MPAQRWLFFACRWVVLDTENACKAVGGKERHMLRRRPRSKLMVEFYDGPTPAPTEEHRKKRIYALNLACTTTRAAQPTYADGSISHDSSVEASMNEGEQTGQEALL